MYSAQSFLYILTTHPDVRIDFSKYPPVWAPAALLYNAMASVDLCGVWNSPAGQSKLPKNLRVPQSEYEWEVARIILDCQPRHRGYIIASRIE